VLTHGRDEKSKCTHFIGKAEGRIRAENLDTCGKDNIRINLRKLGCKVWAGFIWLRIGTSGGPDCCEQGNETLGSIKRGEFLH
jgi:hypothetical protein